MAKKILYLAPRVLGILAILFLMMFSLDCFGGGVPLKEMAVCFLMHNIPAFIVILVLVIAWKWEMSGGLLFIAAAITGSIYFNGFGRNPGVLILMVPFLVTGVLFLLHDFLYLRRTN